MIRAAAVVLVVLLARTLAYAALPDPSARFLRHQAGGPTVPAIALVALGLCAVLAVTVCWLVAVAVRERALIERRVAERFAVARTCALALWLTVAACFAGGILEAYLHWRAGLGWHGLHCLVGPVHRDLLPIEAGLSFVAAALMAAARHIGAWMRQARSKAVRSSWMRSPGTFRWMSAFGRRSATMDGASRPDRRRLMVMTQTTMAMSRVPRAARVMSAWARGEMRAKTRMKVSRYRVSGRTHNSGMAAMSVVM